MAYKWCNFMGCIQFTGNTLETLADINWQAVKVPGSDKVVCYCPKHKQEVPEPVKSKSKKKGEVKDEKTE